MNLTPFKSKYCCILISCMKLDTQVLLHFINTRSISSRHTLLRTTVQWYIRHGLTPQTCIFGNPRETGYARRENRSSIPEFSTQNSNLDEEEFGGRWIDRHNTLIFLKQYKDNIKTIYMFNKSQIKKLVFSSPTKTHFNLHWLFVNILILILLTWSSTVI